MMKKLTLAALAVCLWAGLGNAEQPTVGGPENYRVYKASNVQTGSNKVTNSAYLHKVIISSPSLSATSELAVYNAQSSDTNEVFTLQADTTSISGLTEWTFDIYLSSGLRTGFSASASTGSAQVIFAPGGVQQDYKVWSSSFIVNDAAAHEVSSGPVLLHKIMVLKKGTGTAVLGVFNQKSDTPTDANRIANIDLTDASREYVFNAMLPKGLTVKANGAGTAVPEYIILYKKNPRRDEEYWNVHHSTWAQTNVAIFAGRGVFGGVINGDVSADSNIKIYNANGTASNIIAEIDGATQFSRSMYDMHVSSGLTFTNTGSGMFSILYRRLR